MSELGEVHFDPYHHFRRSSQYGLSDKGQRKKVHKHLRIQSYGDTKSAELLVFCFLDLPCIVADSTHRF
ncbi:putative methyltransferase tdiE [Fusarium oxysporum f. sp. albedinis]|nr:putative methyltransferase tdiE [Fusarium oxysporum f. sp. albedinis]